MKRNASGTIHGFGSLKLFALLLLSSPAWAQSPPALQDILPEVQNTLVHQQLQVTVKETVAIACNPYHRIASWVAFPLSKASLDVKPRLKRWSGSYLVDTDLAGPCQVQHEEYKPYNKAGYDRGHLADAESFNGSVEGNKEVAHTSNLTPQMAAFNRGIWAQLESWARDQARAEGEVVVYVGPVLNQNLPHLETNISIPEKFFKIIVDLTPPVKAIGFVIAQGDRGDFMQHVMCPKDIEALTGLTFGDHLLGTEKENAFKNCDVKEWGAEN